MNIDKINPYKFLFSSGLLYLANNNILKYILNKNNNFITYNSERKEYIITNINKSFFLLLIAIYFCYNIKNGKINLLNLQIDDNDLINYKNITSFYSITDLISTILCFKTMKSSTIFHHVCVILVNLWILQAKKINELQKGIIIYGGFSSMAFLVNFFLGYRFLTKNYNIMKKIVYNNYVIACLLNWSWQSFHTYKFFYKKNTNYKGFILYLFALYFWISDDIKLMEFLALKN